MLEQRVQQQFFESADLLYQCAETLARPVADAAAAVVACVSAGGKVLIAAGREGFAEHAAARLCGRFERERPPLAALALQAGVAAAPQLLALAQPGDLLLLQSAEAPEAAPALLACAEAARERELNLLLLSGSHAGWPLGEADVQVAVAHARAARVAEAHLVVLHALCDAVDAQLFGEAAPA